MDDTRDTVKVCERCNWTPIRTLDARLNDPDSDIVREALTRTCDICKAGIGQLCSNVIQPGHPIPGRIIHIGRKSPR